METEWSPPWMRQAACRSVPTKVFFVDDSRANQAAVAAARAWCEICPVRAECLAFAMQHTTLRGIWGGMTESRRVRERRRLRNLVPDQERG